MSTVKISELTALTSADAADELVIVDDSAGVTKKITATNLNASFDASALDDYEEGTWTATNNGDATGTISDATGAYTKIGNFIMLRCNLRFTANFTSNKIGGLPFVPSSRNAGPSSFWGASAVINASESSLFCTVVDGSPGTIDFYSDTDVDNPIDPTAAMDTSRLLVMYEID